MAKKAKIDFKALANRAAERQDQTVTKTGGDFAPPAEGTSVARFVDYIELGEQKQKAYQGKAKQPTSKVMLVFELLGSKWIKDIEVDKKTKTVADRISVTVPLSLHKKAGFKKLFEKMRYGRDDIVHMAQMLGEGFKVTVTHNKVEEGPNKGKVYANITDEDGNYLVAPPYKNVENDEGEVIETKKIKVPDAISDVRIFLFEEPTVETWDTLFIDGEREVESEGKGKNKTVSKNWIQNMILGAENFEGSALQAMLEGSADLPEDPDELEDDAELEDEEVEEEAEEEAEDDEEEVEDTEEVEEEEEEDETPPPAKAKAKVATKAPAKVTASQQLAAKKAEGKTGKKSVAAATPASTTQKTKPTSKSAPTKSAPAKSPSKGSSAKAALAALGLDD